MLDFHVKNDAVLPKTWMLIWLKLKLAFELGAYSIALRCMIYKLASATAM